jgi:hypothetical protein
LNTTDTLVKDIANIDLVFHNGDIVYANGYIAQWDQFVEQVSNISKQVPYMLSRYSNPSQPCFSQRPGYYLISPHDPVLITFNSTRYY